jgi:hypothetical protein
LWIALDPHCHAEAKRIKQIVKHARIMDLSEKPDDAFVSGMMTARDFKALMRQGR